MKTLLRGSAALAAVLLVAAGVARMAQAADVIEPAAPDYSWSGLYVGAYAGAGAFLTEGDAEGVGVATADFTEGGDGFLLGGLLGFNWQASERFVLGLQGDIAWTDMGYSSFFQQADIDPDFIASASLRAGFLVTPDTLLYAIGGYSYAELDLDDGFSDFNEGSFDGYHIGAGLETRLTQRLTARIEYRYTDLGSEKIFDEEDTRLDMSARTHTGTLGLAYNLFPTEGEGSFASPAAAVVEPAVSWTGLYVGVNGGAGALLSGIGEDSDDELEAGGDGFLGALLAGFNWQAGERFVLGLEGAVGLTDMASDFELVFSSGNSTDIEQELDWFASASLRAGWLVSPETMIYVLGGYSHTEMELKVAFNGVSADDSAGLDGFHAGAGIEAMLTDSLTARIEYRYTDYGTADYDFGLPQTLFHTDIATHTGTIGLAWLFN